MKNPGAGHYRLIWLSGAGFVLLSVLSVVLSLGAPGLGWGLATVTMVVVSLCSRLVGRRWLYICLAVTTIHLLTLGPLGGGAGSSFGTDWYIGAVFAAIPFIAGIGALVVTYLKSRK
jgi:hypothetical protein